MKYTQENTQQTLNSFRELTKLADEYVNGPYNPKRYGVRPTRINIETGHIEKEVNTACHCHPEYEWRSVASFETFIAWVINKQNKETK